MDPRPAGVGDRHDERLASPQRLRGGDDQLVRRALLAVLAIGVVAGQLGLAGRRKWIVVRTADRGLLPSLVRPRVWVVDTVRVVGVGRLRERVRGRTSV